MFPGNSIQQDAPCSMKHLWNTASLICQTMFVINMQIVEITCSNNLWIGSEYEHGKISYNEYEHGKISYSEYEHGKISYNLQRTPLTLSLFYFLLY